MNNGQYSHVCRSGHPLNYSNSSGGYFSGSFSCDYCHNSYPCTVGRYNCMHCKFDVCNQCASGFKPAATPVYNCKFGHTLVYTSNQMGYPTNTYACDACHRQGMCTLGRWNCPTCQYDICSFCRLPPATGPAPYSVPFSAPAPVPYSMPQYQSPPQPAPYSYPMPYQGPIPGSYPAPYPAPNPYMKTQCPSGHFLQQTTFGAGYMGGMYCCDQCHQSGYCSMGRFCCPACKYDLCKSCKPY